MLGIQTKSIMTLRFLTILAALLSTISLRADDRPNVLFIAVDDLNHCCLLYTSDAADE